MMINDVEIGQWRKSRYSVNDAKCVEVADAVTGGARFVRDSKLGEGSPVLGFTGEEWAAFTAGVRDGDFG